jgi:NADH dehydrogenase/NADH:ubiquinone oxidoreductase subunit G
MASLLVDRKKIEAADGTPLLKACLDNGIYIPNLCYLEGVQPPAASCRLCFVEIEGGDGPVASCSVPVREAMVVSTDTPAVRRLQRTGLQLLLSVHDVDCKNCPANRQCALQDLARFLKVGLKPKGLPRRLKEPAIDNRHPCLDYYPNRCVLCGRCVATCRVVSDRPELTFAKRGFDTVIGFFLTGDSHREECAACRACVESCPVGALSLKNQPASSA